MPKFLSSIFKAPKISIYVPGAIPAGSEYGIYMTAESQEDKIRIHPDGTIEWWMLFSG